jgi:hypothetical protein
MRICALPAIGVAVQMIFLSLVYFELASFFNRFKLKSWYLAIIGGIILYLRIIYAFPYGETLLLEYELGFVASKEVQRVAFLTTFSFPLIAAVFAILPGIFLYKQLKMPMPKIKEVELEEKYIGGVYLFMTEVYNMLGGSGQTIFESAVKGYNERSNKNLKIDNKIHLSGLTDEEWPKFIEFLLHIFYQCIGPVTFECCKKIREMPELKEIVERAEEKLRKP